MSFLLRLNDLHRATIMTAAALAAFALFCSYVAFGASGDGGGADNAAKFTSHGLQDRDNMSDGMFQLRMADIGGINGGPFGNDHATYAGGCACNGSVAHISVGGAGVF